VFLHNKLMQAADFAMKLVSEQLFKCVYKKRVLCRRAKKGIKNLTANKNQAQWNMLQMLQISKNTRLKSLREKPCIRYQAIGCDTPPYFLQSLDKCGYVLSTDREWCSACLRASNHCISAALLPRILCGPSNNFILPIITFL